MRILFVCSENRLRSPTAEAVFTGRPGVEALSAGTNSDCETPVSGDLIEWADVILVMERTHEKKLKRRFGELLRRKRVGVLGIPDQFPYMDDLLVELLKLRVRKYL